MTPGSVDSFNSSVTVSVPSLFRTSVRNTGLKPISKASQEYLTGISTLAEPKSLDCEDKVNFPFSNDSLTDLSTPGPITGELVSQG